MPKIGDRVLFGKIKDFSQFNELKDILQGTFFAGTQKALRMFYENFFNLHDRRMSQGIFIGKDQTLMNLIAYKFHPESVVLLQSCKFSCNYFTDRWFFFQRYFAQLNISKILQNRLDFLEFLK